MRQIIKYKSCVVLVLYIICTSAFGQITSLKFLDDFKAAKAQAKAEGKHVLVYVYNDYCSDCNSMERGVFKRQDVRLYYSKNHVLVKLHYRKNGKKFVWKNKIKTYPTFLFYNEEGKELHRITGFKNQEQFIHAAEISYRNPNEQKKKYEKEYRKLKNDPDFLIEYLSFAEDIGSNRLIDQIVDQIIKRKETFEELVWMDLVMNNVYHEKSKLFKLLIEQKDSFYEVYGEAEVKKLILEIMIYDELSKINYGQLDKLPNKIKQKLNKHKLKVTNERVYPEILNLLDLSYISFKYLDSVADLYLFMINDDTAKFDMDEKTKMIELIIGFKEDEVSLKYAEKILHEMLEINPTKKLKEVKKILEIKKTHK